MKEFGSEAQQLTLYAIAARGNRPNMGPETCIATLDQGGRVLLSAGTIYSIEGLPKSHSELSPISNSNQSK